MDTTREFRWLEMVERKWGWPGFVFWAYRPIARGAPVLLPQIDRSPRDWQWGDP